MRSKDLRKSDQCLNCGHSFKNGPDNYCPQCGQENTHKKVPISRLFIEFLGDSFSFDSRIFKSLIYLVLRPGFLTKEYIQGRRVPYIPPLRFFLVTGVLYFALIGYQEKELFSGIEFGDLSIADSTTFDIESIGHEDQIQILDNDKKGLDTLAAMYKHFRGQANIDTTQKPAEMQRLEDEAVARFFRQFERLGTEQAILQQFLSDNLSLLILLLLPVFALLLKILYLGSSNWYIDHLIFSLHVHTFVYILLILQALLIFLEINIMWVLLVLAGYLFIGMYKVYGQNKWVTLFKWGALLTSYFIVAGLAFILYILLAFYLY